MRISLVQTSIFWEQPEANLAHFEQLIKPLSGATDIIVLPEMFTTGFSMKAHELAVSMQSDAITWMKTMAATSGAAVVGSLMIKEGTVFFNRLVWAFPDGKLIHYDKRHLFSYAGEHEVFQAGGQVVSVYWKEMHIRPFVCYDLRFPVWSRNTDRYDLAIYVANWPARRADAWKSLLKARAIENQCFIVGVNIVGQDGNGLEYKGASSVFGFDGQLIYDALNGNGIRTIELELEALKGYRERFRFLDDMDRFTVLS